MFKRLKPLVIHGRIIGDPLAVELAQFLTEDALLRRRTPSDEAVFLAIAGRRMRPGLGKTLRRFS